MELHPSWANSHHTSSKTFGGGGGGGGGCIKKRESYLYATVFTLQIPTFTNYFLIKDWHFKMLAAHDMTMTGTDKGKYIHTISLSPSYAHTHTHTHTHPLCTSILHTLLSAYFLSHCHDHTKHREHASHAHRPVQTAPHFTTSIGVSTVLCAGQNSSTDSGTVQINGVCKPAKHGLTHLKRKSSQPVNL